MLYLCHHQTSTIPNPRFANVIMERTDITGL